MVVAILVGVRQFLYALKQTINKVPVKQDELRKILKTHVEIETLKGMEIHPAAQKQIFSPEGRADDNRKDRMKHKS